MQEGLKTRSVLLASGRIIADAGIVGGQDGLGSIGDAQLDQDGGDVVPHCFLADPELVGY